MVENTEWKLKAVSIYVFIADYLQCIVNRETEWELLSFYTYVIVAWYFASMLDFNDYSWWVYVYWKIASHTLKRIWIFEIKISLNKNAWKYIFLTCEINWNWLERLFFPVLLDLFSADGYWLNPAQMVSVHF